jgi:transcriptional regulator with XRE-family HTH domain
MPVKSDRSLGWTRRSAAVSVLLAMDEHRAQAGQRLRVLREQRGWSQEDLARESKLSTKTVSRFENGRHDGRRQTIRQLAEALGIDEFEILGDPPNPLGGGIRDQVDGVSDEFREHVATMLHRLDQIDAELRTAHQERLSLRAEIKAQNQLLAKQEAILENIEELVEVLRGAEITTDEEAPAADGGARRELPAIPPGPLTEAHSRAQEQQRSTATSDREGRRGQGQRRRTAGR